MYVYGRRSYLNNIGLNGFTIPLNSLQWFHEYNIVDEVKHRQVFRKVSLPVDDPGFVHAPPPRSRAGQRVAQRARAPTPFQTVQSRFLESSIGIPSYHACPRYFFFRILS